MKYVNLVSKAFKNFHFLFSWRFLQLWCLTKRVIQRYSDSTFQLAAVDEWTAHKDSHTSLLHISILRWLGIWLAEWESRRGMPTWECWQDDLWLTMLVIETTFSIRDPVRGWVDLVGGQWCHWLKSLCHLFVILQ